VLGPWRVVWAARSGQRWTERRRGLSHSGALPMQGAPGIVGFRSSLAEAREEEDDEVVPMRSSPRQRSSVMVMEDGGRSFM
jgi:hypothetical protein